MIGRQRGRAGLPFRVGLGTAKTFAIEVNAPDGDPDRAVARARDLLVHHGLELATTSDPSVAVAWSESLGLFIDVLDPRFWLIHSMSNAARVQRLLHALVWRSPDLDWCWFSQDVLNRMQGDGETRWFRSDFRGDELLAGGPAGARRLKVQLEGDNAEELLRILQRSAAYQSSAALTTVALHLANPDLGYVDEAAHYRGRFVARGDSFALHLGFVSRWVQEYAAAVRKAESDHQIVWHRVGDSDAFNYSGRTAMIRFGRPIKSLDHFVASLFSCRDPFRLWAVPRPSRGDAIEAEVVDLHLGQQLRMDITREWLRVYLPEGACGNTLFRLVSNLQHRYDATIAVPS